MNAAQNALRYQINQIAHVTVSQGEILVSAEPKVLVTILGSCVAVCLWDRVRGAGGMNHFVLPCDLHGDNNPRYGDVAIDQLVAGLLRLGCSTASLQAKIFGGAAVVPFSGGKSIGSSNVEVALERLSGYRIPVTGQRTGGHLGQQIKFYIATGEVLFRHLTGGTNSRTSA